jgi:hypothetical protein
MYLQSLGWRTMLVVPELEQELAVAEATRATQFELKMLRNARSDLDTQVRLRAVMKLKQNVPMKLLFFCVCTVLMVLFELKMLQMHVQT